VTAKNSKPRNGSKHHKAKEVLISALTPHPRNYRGHPPDQVAHIRASIEQHGFYRNVVTAKDYTILAGHGVVEACQELGIETVPVVKHPIAPDSPQALKVLTGDNHINRLSFDDDRELTNLLKELADEGDLLGSGFDDLQLAALLMNTRPASEIASYDAAAEWVGMPSYSNEEPRYKLILAFETDEVRAELMTKLGVIPSKMSGLVTSAWYPPRKRENPAAMRFEPEDSSE
jgi:hypothetical protein